MSNNNKVHSYGCLQRNRCPLPTFCRRGAKVVVNYASSKEGADKVVKAITDNGGTAIAVQGDVSNIAEVNRAMKQDQLSAILMC